MFKSGYILGEHQELVVGQINLKCETIDSPSLEKHEKGIEK